MADIVRQNRPVTAHDDWVQRDAQVVWHGFTQMSTFAENHPIIVDRAEGHELIDVDGKHYLDAISSLWVTTLGHHVPELDDAIVRQLALGAHSTMLGNGNRVVVELSEALARVVPVDDPHFLYASDGASAVEQALKIAVQYWHNLGVGGRTTFLAFGGAYHGDTIGALSVGDDGFGADVFNALRFPVLRAPAFDDPECFDVAARLIAEHASELAAVIVEPSVQAAAGMQLADHEGLARLGAACRDARRAVDLRRDRDGLRAHGHAVRVGAVRAPARPAVPGQGSHRGVPADVGHGRERARVRSVPRRRPRRAHAVPRPFVRRERARGRGRAASPRTDRRVGRARERARTLRRARGTACTIGSRRSPRSATCACADSWARSSSRRPTDGLKWGRRVSAAAVERGVLLRSIGDNVTLMPPLTITSSELHRMVHALSEAIDEVGDEVGA